MNTTTHIRTTRRTYIGAIILSALFILSQYYITDKSLWETISGTPGMLAVAVVLYALYKIVFGKGKIIMTETEFKVRGYSWTNWNDLAAVYPFVEQDAENGSQHYIHFRLTDGSDQSLRSEYLDATFEEIAALVNQYKTDYQNAKQ